MRTVEIAASTGGRAADGGFAAVHHIGWRCLAITEYHAGTLVMFVVGLFPAVAEFIDDFLVFGIPLYVFPDGNGAPRIRPMMTSTTASSTRVKPPWATVLRALILDIALSWLHSLNSWVTDSFSKCRPPRQSGLHPDWNWRHRCIAPYS